MRMPGSIPRAMPGAGPPPSAEAGGRARAAAAGAILLLAVAAASCASKGPVVYGLLTGDPPLVAVGDLLDSPEIRLGTDVTVTGTVAQVCREMGCWFEVEENGRRLMVDLEMGRRFTIPESSAGRRARVEGRFVRQDGVLKIVGRGVELGAPPAA